MSAEQVTPIMIAIVGGLTVLVVAVLVIAQMAGISFLSSSSNNLVSASQGLSELIVIFAAMIGIGVVGFIVQKR